MKTLYQIFRRKPDGSIQKRTFKNPEKAGRVLAQWTMRGIQGTNLRTVGR